MLSREERNEIETFAIRLDEIASALENALEYRSDRWKESPKGEQWQAYAEAVRDAACALELAEEPE
jgi:hypothetical protein